LVIGLLLLIPIVGAINGIGWMLASLDNLRRGDERLAPANLDHLGRGIRLFAVQLVYQIGLTAVALVIYVPGLVLAVHQGQGSANAALLALAIVLNLVGFSIIALGSLALTFALPAIVLATDMGGVGAGLQVVSVVRRCRVNVISTLIAGLMLIAAGFVGTLGLILCGVGVLFTAAYAYAMQAWIVRSFETGSNALPAAAA